MYRILCDKAFRDVLSGPCGRKETDTFLTEHYHGLYLVSVQIVHKNRKDFSRRPFIYLPMEHNDVSKHNFL